MIIGRTLSAGRDDIDRVPHCWSRIGVLCVVFLARATVWYRENADRDRGQLPVCGQCEVKKEFPLLFGALCHRITVREYIGSASTQVGEPISNSKPQGVRLLK